MTDDIMSAEIPTQGSEVLTVNGKDVLKVDHPVPDPGALTTFVSIQWFVELCEPYLFLIDAEGGVMSASIVSNPGGSVSGFLCMKESHL